MILLIDNYDSFVHNLARHFRRLGVETLVRRNDAIRVKEIRLLHPQAIVLSPGPCTPREAGVSLELVRELYREIPILGVCLGHQTIAEALGGRIVRGEPVHGQASLVTHLGTDLFADVPSPMVVGRYHSLVVEAESLPSELLASAWTNRGELMALAHRELPVYGVQFHPESILTSHGYLLLANFLRLARILVSSLVTEFEATERRPEVSPAAFPRTVTPHAWSSF